MGGQNFTLRTESNMRRSALKTVRVTTSCSTTASYIPLSSKLGRPVERCLYTVKQESTDPGLSVLPTTRRKQKDRSCNAPENARHDEVASAPTLPSRSRCSGG